MAIIGSNTIGGTTDNWNNDQYIGTRFTAPVSGIISTIWVYVADAYGGGFNTFSTSVYAVTSSLPSTLLSTGSGAPLSNTLGWQSCSITPMSVVAGTEYYLNVWGEVAITVAYDAGSTNQMYDRYFVTYNAWDSPFSGTNYNQSSRQYSIYADIVSSGVTTAWLTV